MTATKKQYDLIIKAVMQYTYKLQTDKINGLNEDEDFELLQDIINKLQQQQIMGYFK